MLAAILLALIAGPQLGTLAQEAAPLQAQTGTTQAAELPTVLIVVQRPAPATVRRDDPNIQLLTTLSGMLRDSGRFHVVLYAPKHPTVRRALLEGTLSTADLIEPMKPETLQLLGRTLGAHFVLSFLANADKNGLRTDALLQESMGQREWRTLFSEQIAIPATSGKRRLKREDMIRLTVDTFAMRMNLPARLAANLHIEETGAGAASQGEKSRAETQPPTATTGNNNGDNTAGPSKTFNKAPQKGKTPPDSASPKNDKESKPSNTAAQPGSEGTEPTQPSLPTPPPAAKGDKTDTNKKPATSQPGKAAAQDVGPARPLPGGNPPLADLAPDGAPDHAGASAAPKVDYEALALRFRQSGDLANLITSLRRAINERPRDMGLRRQLIQAYQDRQLPDAALAEVNRALQLAPNDASLRRLSGDALLAKGDAAGALKAYQEAARIDPGDVLTQVALGDALLADNQYGEAMRAYEVAAKNDPKSPLPHRHKARALARSAAADPARYAESLAEIQTARSLIPPTDTETYQEDYVALMRLMTGRLSDLLDELQAAYQAALTGKRTREDLIRLVADMRLRAEAAGDYLDKLPPGAGQDGTHAHYQQAAAFLLQSLSLFRDYVANNDIHAEETMKGAHADARRELNTASHRLNASRAVPSVKPTDESAQTNAPDADNGAP